MTGLAGLLPLDTELHLGAANCLPEIDVQPVFEVGAAFRLGRVRPLSPTTAKEITENIAESKTFRVRSGSTARAATLPLLLLPHELGKVESAKVRSARCTRPRAASVGRHVRRVKTELIVRLPLLVVAQNIVRFLNFLEPFLGSLIARIQIRVVFPRQFSI
jgi:hypothetical protein